MKPTTPAAKILIVLAALTITTTACARGAAGTTFAPTTSSLYITSEGVITSATIQPYEADYYTEEGLRASTEEYLAAFNTAAGQSSVQQASQPATLKECTLSSGTAKLLIEFDTPASYLRFTEEYPDEEGPIQIESLDVVPVPDGLTKGYMVGQTFTSTDGKTVASGDVTKQTKLTVIAVEGPATIQTDGAIQYVSEGVTISGSNQVKTPESGVSYIVFK